MSASKKLIREKFRTQVFARDGYNCVFCERRDQLDAHHITDRSLMPNGGYVVENWITLCPEHHLLAEEVHRVGFTEPGFSPAELYEKINSSYNAAVEAAREL